jgi:hypothetical protein
VVGAKINSEPRLLSKNKIEAYTNEELKER